MEEEIAKLKQPNKAIVDPIEIGDQEIINELKNLNKNVKEKLRGARIVFNNHLLGIACELASEDLSVEKLADLGCRALDFMKGQNEQNRGRIYIG